MLVLIILHSFCLIYLGMFRLTNMGIAGFATGLYICYIQTCSFVYKYVYVFTNVFMFYLPCINKILRGPTITGNLNIETLIQKP